MSTYWRVKVFETHLGRRESRARRACFWSSSLRLQAEEQPLTPQLHNYRRQDLGYGLYDG
jgi:hypothetical protein